MKRLAKVTVFLLGVIILVLLGAEYYPAFYRTRIVDAPGKAILQPYAAEFAAAAGYQYDREMGSALPAPAQSFHPGSRSGLSSDGTWTLEQTAIEASAIVQQPAAQLKTATMLPILQRSVAQLPWGINIALMERIEHLPTRLGYAEKALQEGWTRDTLTLQIKNRAHERQGAAITNFATPLQEAHAAIAQGLLKDPYLFDFLTLEEPRRAR